MGQHVYVLEEVSCFSLLFQHDYSKKIRDEKKKMETHDIDLEWKKGLIQTGAPSTKFQEFLI
jgi:hypothetical protein